MNRPTLQTSKSVLILLLLAMSAGLLLLLHFVEPPGTGLWTRTFFDAAHVPVFGIVAPCVFVATGIRAQWNLPRRCAVVAAAVLVLSIISEAAQIPGRRDASLHDLLFDWLGAAGFLLLGIAFVTSNTIAIQGNFFSASLL